MKLEDFEITVNEEYDNQPPSKELRLEIYDLIYVRPDGTAIELELDKIDHEAKTINFK